MGSASGDRGYSSRNVNESGSRPWTSLMSRAEQNISSSCQRLEHAFEDINHDSKQIDTPCPIKIIRRLTALEIALGQLKQDCVTISAKRKSIVQSVISDQNENMGHAKKILPMTDAGSSLEYQIEDARDTNWNELSLEMKMQLDHLSPVAGSYNAEQRERNLA